MTNCINVNNDVKMFRVLSSLSCFYTNADQFRNKFAEFQTRISTYQPMLIGVTEVKPKNSTYKLNPTEFNLDLIGDYDLFTLNLDRTKGRGLILYTHKSVQAKEVTMDSEYDENIFLKIVLNSTDCLLIGLLYRHRQNG